MLFFLGVLICLFNVTAASIVDEIKYTVQAVNCSSVYFTCWTTIPNINNCTLNYRVNKSDDEFSVQLLPVNSTVALLENLTKFELYNFILSIKTENESLAYQIVGTFMWKSCKYLTLEKLSNINI